MKAILAGLAVAASLTASASAAAQDAAEPAGAEAVTIDDAAWLAGRWVGEGLGGALEEVWSPPAGGQMVGHFALRRDGAPAFYEIMLMDVADGGVRMQVRHFDPDFTSWEERDDRVVFEPVSAGPDALAFDGLVIRRTGDDEIEMSLSLRDGDGVREEILRLRRAPL